MNRKTLIRMLKKIDEQSKFEDFQICCVDQKLIICNKEDVFKSFANLPWIETFNDGEYELLAVDLMK